MAGSGRTAEQGNVVQPGTREKGAYDPYRDPTQVLMAAKATVCRDQPTLGNSAR